MISVGISGAPGRMGRLSLAALLPLDDLAVGGLYAPGHDGEDLSGHRCSGDPEALRHCDVILEFTNPDVAPANVSRWRSFDAHVVIGTSGYDSGRLAGLAEEWAGTARRCLVVPNFSVGAVLMMRFAELAAPHFASAEIIELHHEDKPDAPSGTSLNTAARIAAARRDAGLTPHGRGRELAPGALGAEVEGVPIHSVRAHGFVAHQEVILGGTGEYLTIRHDTTNYRAFAPGIILALREVSLLADPLTVGLESILGI
ncbi:MAG: 4-hydroxy-tetrahydrodipicolinate reductase [bacterium]|nr:4-hydroxy-tetrahydrodipicolinate reductase [bacterium]MDE0290685.1 4-hydroxy-tetrahydrodipicolinate reductase [bacterium]MDE0437238.1 4-hydroxy-tetrahydrodipicolinate reductase [bacterium]